MFMLKQNKSFENYKIFPGSCLQPLDLWVSLKLCEKKCELSFYSHLCYESLTSLPFLRDLQELLKNIHVLMQLKYYLIGTQQFNFNHIEKFVIAQFKFAIN